MYAPHGLLAVRCFLPSVLCVGVHDTYFQLPVPLHRPAEFRHFQQALGVGNDEDTIEAGPHPADFVDQLRHIDEGCLPDGSAVDTLPDKPLTGAPYLGTLFIEAGKLLIGQPDVNLVCSASHGFSFLQRHRGGSPVKRTGSASFAGAVLRIFLIVLFDPFHALAMAS